MCSQKYSERQEKKDGKYCKGSHNTLPAACHAPPALVQRYASSAATRSSSGLRAALVTCRLPFQRPMAVHLTRGNGVWRCPIANTSNRDPTPERAPRKRLLISQQPRLPVCQPGSEALARRGDSDVGIGAARENWPGKLGRAKDCAPFADQWSLSAATGVTLMSCV
jgi:hypothetical protein